MRLMITKIVCAALLAGGAAYAQTPNGGAEMDNAIEKNSRRNASEASQGGPNSPATNTPGKAGTAPARAKAQPGNQTGAEKKAEVDESVIQLYEAREFQGMPYRLMKPIDFDPSTAYPLIVSLHGKGGVGTDNLGNLRVWTAFLAREELRRKHPCFVLAPQTPTSWTTDDEPAPVLTEDSIKNYPEAWRGFLQRRMTTQPSPPPARASAGGDLSKAFDLVAEIEYEFRIDRSRIYVLGHSMGGFGSWNAIWAKPEMFAAAIPTAGALMPWKDPKRFANVPIWAFHGSADPLVPVDFTREIFAAMKQCGGNMKYTEMQGVNHGCNVPAFQYTGDDAAKGWITQCSSDRCERESDIWDWLFNQKRP